MYTVPYCPRAFNAYLISYPSCPCQAGSYADGANNMNCLGRTGRQCDFSRDGYRTCQPYASEGFAYNIYQGGGWRWPKSSRKCRRFLEINILLARSALFSVQWWGQEYTHTYHRELLHQKKAKLINFSNIVIVVFCPKQDFARNKAFFKVLMQWTLHQILQLQKLSWEVVWSLS